METTSEAVLYVLRLRLTILHKTNQNWKKINVLSVS